MAGLVAFSLAICVRADNLNVENFNQYGPVGVQMPAAVDSLDVDFKTFSPESLIGKPKLRLPKIAPGEFSGAVAPSADVPAVGYLQFKVSNSRYAKADLNVKGLKDYAVYVDGKKLDGTALSLTPATRDITIQYLSLPDRTDSISVSLEGDNLGNLLSLATDGKKMFTLDQVLDGEFVDGGSISPEGNRAIVRRHTVMPGGETDYTYLLKNLKTGKTDILGRYAAWMPRSERYYFTRQGMEGSEVVAVNPATGSSEVLAQNLPDGYFSFTPDEKKMIVTVTNEAPAVGAVHQILNPEDRQPGWRDRNTLYIYDLESRNLAPLTHGYRNVSLLDIAPDSKRALVMANTVRMGKRPTAIFSIYEIDLDTHALTPLVEDDGYVSNAIYSPDGTQVLVMGAPEALGGIGKNVPEGRIPSSIDAQLFMITLADGSRKALTRDFNPCVQSMAWSEADGNIYFTAEDRDYINMFRLNPKTGKITQVQLPEENIGSISLAVEAPKALFKGESTGNPARLYSLDLAKLQPTVIDDSRDKMMAGVAIGECRDWTFRNYKGDEITCRYYLPADFDPNKKYPMIVNYYGGCSPTSRIFASRYPQSAYAALGYVVLVINPSGATGFGQEFSSRHVNTAGKGVAEDIIEGTKKFCTEHSFVNPDKIGCIGASYGGFMSQYLPTQTDMFAASVSHAGISDHTSYWGNGYWGYSYSEVSMADSYPWSDQDLYVGQSPLYNAEKINTPLLLVHGGADTNVPVGESIQLFTALKLLGKETAFVEVDGEDHWILDYDKRRQWQNTIFAWFAKWLQDDPTWWDAMYPAKNY